MANNTVIRTVGEAPIDGTPYSRQDGTWVAASTGGIGEAPSTLSYVRTSLGWRLPELSLGLINGDTFNLGVDNTSIVTELPMATQTTSGIMSAADKLKLDTSVAPTTSDDLTEGTVNLYNRIPSGGTAGQLLSKIDGTDYNVEWTDATGEASSKNFGPIVQIAIPQSASTTAELLALLPSDGNLDGKGYILRFDKDATYNFTEFLDFSSIYNGSLTLTGSVTGTATPIININTIGSSESFSIIASGYKSNFNLSSLNFNLTADDASSFRFLSGSPSLYSKVTMNLLDVVFNNNNATKPDVTLFSTGRHFTEDLSLYDIDIINNDASDVVITSSISGGSYFPTEYSYFEELYNRPIHVRYVDILVGTASSNPYGLSGIYYIDNNSPAGLLTGPTTGSRMTPVLN